MAPRFVEVSLQGFFEIFLQSVPANEPLEDLQALVDDEKLLLSEQFPEISELEILSKIPDEREAYPLLVCILFVLLTERLGIR